MRSLPIHSDTTSFVREVYYEFLNEMKKRDCYWQALPGEVAKWWRTRSAPDDAMHRSSLMAQLTVVDEDIHIGVPFELAKDPIQP